MKQSMLYPKTTRTRRVIDLCGMWDFQFDPQSSGEAEGWQNGLPNPCSMVVPASFNDFFTDKASREYAGDFWYATTFIAPAEWEGSHLDLRFDAATHRAAVYVNGQNVGCHEGGFLPFTVRLDNVVNWGQKNIVAVKLNNELTHATLPAGTTKVFSDGTKMIKPYFDFFNYAGLQRPVRLVVTPQEEILDFTVNHHLNGSGAQTDYEVVTSGEHSVHIDVLDEEGKIVAQADGKEGTIKIPDAHLWNVLDAYLYTFRITIHDNGVLIDEYEEEIGIRTVEIRGTDILLNGKPVYLKGFGKHEDFYVRGRGLDLAVAKRDFELMKWIGANSFRTSHYPYSEEILQMADREGFLVIDEVAAVGFFASLMNFMEASTGVHTSFFKQDIVQTQTKANHKAALRELICRDKNHACVIAWSLLNEPETTDESAVPYFEEIFALAHELDVQKRPRTFALIMNSLPDTCKCYKFSDFMSLNRYYGWYQSGGYEIREAKEKFIAEMNQWRDLQLNKPFVFTEFGTDTLAGLHKLPSVMWSEEYQSEYMKMQFEVFDAYDFVKGEQIWNFADFQTTEGIMRVNGNKKGVFTRDRQPKEVVYMLKKRWGDLKQDYKS